jgi:hypothetical protein
VKFARREVVSSVLDFEGRRMVEFVIIMFLSARQIFDLRVNCTVYRDYPVESMSFMVDCDGDRRLEGAG